MKCKKCGYRTTTINGMRKHYMKAHPAAMKHHGPRKRLSTDARIQNYGYCPSCGGRL